MTLSGRGDKDLAEVTARLAELDSLVTGAERIAAAFEAARGEGRAALMPYLMGGFPDAETSRAVIEAYADAGADLIELGVPFSDPLADGPVIHAAATKALAAGATFDSVLEVGQRGRRARPGDPDGLREHGPRLRRRGLRRGARGRRHGRHDRPGPAARGGGRGARALCRRAGLALIPLIAPTTPPARRAEICRDATGFIYVVSDTRTTGERDRMPEELGDLVRAVQADASVPAAVGFGIGTPEQAAEVGAVADGVIVGSRLVREVAEAGSADAAAVCGRRLHLGA